MTAIPISHRNRRCFNCTEVAGAFRVTRSMRPWRGRFDHDKRFTQPGAFRPDPFICQGCIEHAAILLDGVTKTEREKVLRRVHQRRDVRWVV